MNAQVSEAERRDVDADEFPIGIRVMTPTGRIGTVVKHQGHASKRDSFMRVIVRIGKRKRDLVTLQPHLLTKCPPDDPAPGLDSPTGQLR